MTSRKNYIFILTLIILGFLIQDLIMNQKYIPGMYFSLERNYNNNSDEQIEIVTFIENVNFSNVLYNQLNKSEIRNLNLERNHFRLVNETWIGITLPLSPIRYSEWVDFYFSLALAQKNFFGETFGYSAKEITCTYQMSVKGFSNYSFTSKIREEFYFGHHEPVNDSYTIDFYSIKLGSEFSFKDMVYSGYWVKQQHFYLIKTNRGFTGINYTQECVVNPTTDDFDILAMKYFFSAI